MESWRIYRLAVLKCDVSRVHQESEVLKLDSGKERDAAGQELL
jgi:hypothetical protein